jgi:hypothetical protein
MKHSYLLAGIKPGRLYELIRRNKGISAQYMSRVSFLLSIGMWAPLFEWREKRHFGKKVKAVKQSTSPVFIVGHWRTGTTLLHQLMALDNQFNYMDVFKVSHPYHFLISRKYYSGVMSKFLKGPRPMDNVKLGMTEPQEDEYALVKMQNDLVLEGLIFQKKDRFFIDLDEEFMPRDKKKFFDLLDLLIRKLQVEKGEAIIPLFKNPFHSLRIDELKAHYPDAKFINIVRDPLRVVPSTIHMWNIVGRQNILKGQWIEPGTEHIARLYLRIVHAIRNSFSKMKTEDYCEIRFEELERKPKESVRGIYEKLQLEFSDDYAKKLDDFIREIKDYKKNSYQIADQDYKMIRAIFEPSMPEYFNKQANNIINKTTTNEVSPDIPEMEKTGRTNTI